jgi:ribosomal RNA-processing protein 1
VLIDPLLDALHPTSASPVLLTPGSSPAKKRRRVDANAAKNTDTSPAPTYANIVANACTVDPLGEGRVDRTSLRAALLRKMFEVAGEEETRVASRKKMFAVFKENMDDSGGDSDEDMTS